VIDAVAAGGAGWRVVWRHEGDDDPAGITVRYGAVAVLPGARPEIIVTEEWHNRVLGALKCDHTRTYRLADGEETRTCMFMFKYPFDHPRVQVARFAEGYAVVVNTWRGVRGFAVGATAEVPDQFGSVEWYARDLVIGTHDGRPVLLATWDVPTDEPDPHVQAYDLATGAPAAPPWRLPGDASWDGPGGSWRLGRWAGRPVVAVAEWALLWLYSPVDGDTDDLVTLENDCPRRCTCGPELFAVDDGAGPPLAVVRQHEGAVWCYDLGTQNPVGPPLTGYPGTATAARLGRLRNRPVVALLTTAGIALHDLSTRRWICHIEAGAKVHDVAFAPPDTIAAVTANGPLVIQISRW